MGPRGKAQAMKAMKATKPAGHVQAMKAMKAAGPCGNTKPMKTMKVMKAMKAMKVKKAPAPKAKQQPAAKCRSGKSNWQAWRASHEKPQTRAQAVHAEQTDMETEAENTKSTQTPFWIKRLRRARGREDLDQHGFDDMLRDSRPVLHLGTNEAVDCGDRLIYLPVVQRLS